MDCLEFASDRSRFLGVDDWVGELSIGRATDTCYLGCTRSQIEILLNNNLRTHKVLNTLANDVRIVHIRSQQSIRYFNRARCVI